MSEQPADAASQALLIYRELKALLERQDLSPSVRANAEQALSAMWQVINNLGVEYEYLYDLSV